MDIEVNTGISYHIPSVFFENWALSVYLWEMFILNCHLKYPCLGVTEGQTA